MATLCGCGKPTSHMGMCSARWAVRKANNGATGDKAKVESAPMSEEAIARRLFGDLADDVLLLRKRGHTVARFKDGFRVDRDFLTDDALRARVRLLCAAKPKPESTSGTTPFVQNVRVLPDRAVSVGRQPDLSARVAQLEQRLEFLFAVVADAIKGRRETLAGQVDGLAKLETELRDNA